MAREAAGAGIRVAAPMVMLGLLLAGCGSQPPIASYPGAGGDGHGTYRVGVPYEIKGVWYHPAVDYNYDRTGTASWYGEYFDGRATANGEVFDLNQLTAAHTTLPMPSIVEVTNLENGRSLQLRVNDRGPFVGGRLIDVSRRAAQLLGFETHGTTLVRVKVLKEESIAAAEEAMHGSGRIEMAEAAGAAPPAARSFAAPPFAPPPPPPVRSFAAPPPPRLPSYAPPSVPSYTPPPAAASVEPAPPQPLPPAIASAPSPPPEAAPQAPPHRSFAWSDLAFAPSASAAPARPAPPSRHTPAGPDGPPALPRAPASPAIAAEPPAAASGRIFVQAGAFSVRDNAQRVRSRIAPLGSVEVKTVSVNGVEIYRVRLGPLSAEQAGRLLSRVVDSGYPGARIVTD